MVYKFFDKKCATTHRGTGINSNSDSENQQLANELQKPIKKKLKSSRFTLLLNATFGVQI